jgi:hypothetical protein
LSKIIYDDSTLFGRAFFINVQIEVNVDIFVVVFLRPFRKEGCLVQRLRKACD